LSFSVDLVPAGKHVSVSVVWLAVAVLTI
jgi:hypothetical protein